MMPSPLSQLFAQGSVEIVLNLDIQDRDKLRLPAIPMTLVGQASGAKRKDVRAAKRNQTLQQEHSDAESKLKAICESRKKASTSFFAVMRPRLKARNFIKYSDCVSLDRDLLILEKALTGKIPKFDMSEDWQRPVLIEQYRNRNVDVYLNRAAERRSAISNE